MIHTRLISILALVICALSVAGIWIVASTRPERPDTATANEIVHLIEAAWPETDNAELPATSPALTVVAEGGDVLLTRGEPITSDLTAHSDHASALAITVDGQRVGTLYLTDPAVTSHAETVTRIAWASTAGVVASALVFLVIVELQRRRLEVPFRRLERFAADVAAGDLDAPLAMDRGNVFGAFSEAFDIMRSELQRSRTAEQEARESKKTLVSQLSHDIRTPIASIAAAAEVLAATETDPARTAKLETILGKAAQVDSLSAELFNANADRMRALPVEPQDLPSTELPRMMRESGSQLRLAALPECVVSADPRRLQQVFDNILGNAQKYAGTVVDVNGSFTQDFLRLTFRDHGPGVPASELDSILGNGVRGSNVGDAEGHGIGLFTSSVLMERMDGSLAVRNADPGFVVVLELPLAR